LRNPASPKGWFFNPKGWFIPLSMMFIYGLNNGMFTTYQLVQDFATIHRINIIKHHGW
jgi:hypothetical protein